MFSSKDLERFFIGFEPLVEKLGQAADSALSTSYPPYNIKRVSDNRYLIEMAVAGFAKQDIDIELIGDTLVIKGNMGSGESAEKQANGEFTWPSFLFNGIASRPFTRTFHIGDRVEIEGASLVNGILKVFLDQLAPATPASRKIDINTK